MGEHDPIIKNRRIEGALSKTVNLGNYESMKIHVGLSADLIDGENLEDAYDKLFSDVEKQLMKEIGPQTQ